MFINVIVIAPPRPPTPVDAAPPRPPSPDDVMEMAPPLQSANPIGVSDTCICRALNKVKQSSIIRKQHKLFILTENVQTHKKLS